MRLYLLAYLLMGISLGCEDIVVDSLTVDSLISILQWSAEAYGSSWVHRQALHFLKEEFIHFGQSQALYDLSKEYLLETVGSDFVQVTGVS